MTGKNIKHGVSRQLDGSNNNRLHSTTPVNNAYTAALTNAEKTVEGSNITIPSLESVIEAKDWVDNGSKT